MSKELYLSSSIKAIITLYIRPDTSKQKILDLLKHEEPIIDNIKSRVTRQGIQNSFQRLKTFLNRMPPSDYGYIICCSPENLVYINDIRVSQDLYKCGGEFYASPLEEIMTARLNPIGILTIDTKEATIAYIGNKVEILKNMTSGISGKHDKGGQSQRRFQRARQQQVKQFFTRVGDACSVFVDSYPITELIVAGCGLTKDKFLKGDYLDYRLKDKVSVILNTQYTGDYGIREALHLALPRLEKNAYAQEMKIVEEFFNILGKRFECIVYGEAEIQKNLYAIKRFIKIEEHSKEYPKETLVLRFHGEHYNKIKSLGGVVGIKC